MNDISFEHKMYLKKIKREKIIVCFFRIFIIVFFLFIWEILSRFNIINTFLYSSPCRIINTIINLFLNGELIKHVGVTVYEVLVSFLLASFIGIVFSSLLWGNRFFSKVVDPYITILNSLPKVALGPLIIIWVGAGINSIIFMALLISIFTTIIGIYQGFISVNENYIIMLRSFGASKVQIFFKVIIPSNIENIISSLKINISMSLIGVIMGELLVSKKGLGYLIMYGSQVFNLDLVISSIFLLGLLSYIMYVFINKILVISRKKRV